MLRSFNPNLPLRRFETDKADRLETDKADRLETDKADCFKRTRLSVETDKWDTLSRRRNGLLLVYYSIRGTPKGGQKRLVKFPKLASPVALEVPEP